MGLGNMGRNHLRTLLSENLTSEIHVIDLDPDKVSRFKHDARVQVLAKNDSSRLDNYDYVVIATPTSSHLETLKEYLHVSKKFLVEKPLATSLEELEIIAALEQEANIKIIVNHIERFNPAIQWLKNSHLKDLVGSIYAIHSARVSTRPVRITDCGVLLDLGSHDIDLTHYLMGCNYEYIQGIAAYQYNNKFEDYVSMIGRLETGIIVTHEINWMSTSKRRTILMEGEFGTIFVDLLQMNVILREKNELRIQAGFLDIIQGDFSESSTIFPIVKYEPLKKVHLQIQQNVLGKERESQRSNDVDFANVESSRTLLQTIDRVEKSFPK